jgi:aryl-alcohol dehydrogenase-like predicted oxidoreductase
MKYRALGRTGLTASEISFESWAIGGEWGTVDDEVPHATLNAAVDSGVTFIDTADVYGMGRSEGLLARLRSARKEPLFVATKAGRKLDPHTADGYTKANLARFVEESLGNLQVEWIDLLQLHCPPTEVYHRPEVFQALDDLGAAGEIRCYGASLVPSPLVKGASS